ncbi:MAG: nucleotidyl transferase AbiEii/AbiGii toxin family protein [Bacteroidales bacterium]|nr:nucleotidyl transferase AbiEii/AbiGii toxin family protein [Bacteroidales bacterium]
MLHLNSTKRLSIDIDIIIPKKPKNLDELLDKVAAEQGFIRKSLQHRVVNSKIDKEHYQFYFTPTYKTKKEEEYVLLDILFEEILHETPNHSS